MKVKIESLCIATLTIRFMHFEDNGITTITTGADLGVSRGGGGAHFQKLFENFVDFF